MTERPLIRNRSRWAWGALASALVVLNIAVFWPGMRGEFVWDDDLLLLDHPNYRRPELILSSLRSLFIISPSYFRPLGYFSFFLDYSVFGPRPHWYHAENLFLHCASTLLVARLCAVLGGSFWAVGAAAAVFAVHPSRVEGVVFISSRFDLLATFLFLSALLLHRHSVMVGSWLWRWCAAVTYGLALSSKEMAVTLPAVAWYADRYLWRQQIPAVSRGEKGPGRWTAYAPYALVLAAYLGLRAGVLGSLIVPRDLSIPIRSSFDHVLLVGKTVFGYFRFAVFPFIPSPVHYVEDLSPADIEVWLGFAALFVAVWAVLTGHARGAFRDGLVLFFLLLLPVMNLVPIRLAGPSFMAERFLYLPLVAASLGMLALPWQRRGIRGLCVLLVLSWMAVCRHASAQWVDDRTLFGWVARRTPQSALGFTNLSLEETRGGGSPIHAIALGESALVRDRVNPDAWDNVGVAYYQMGMLAEAESCFAHALRLAPGHPLFTSNLAGTWRTMGRFPQALRLLNEVIARDSTAASAYLNVGLCYLRMGHADSAVAPLRRAAVLMEVDTTTWMTLAQALVLDGHADEAMSVLDRAGRYGLGPAEAGAQMAAWGREALQQRRIRDAMHLLRTAGALLPADPTIANDAGVSLRTSGELAAAESCFSRATKLAPDLDIAWANLGEIYWIRGNERAADSVLAIAMSRWPNLPDPYRHLGRLRWSQGRRDSAASLFAEYLKRAPAGIFATEVRDLLGNQ